MMAADAKAPKRERRRPRIIKYVIPPPGELPARGGSPEGRGAGGHLLMKTAGIRKKTMV